MKISIFKFLARYYGIALNAAVNCSHTEVKRNFPFIEVCSIRYVNQNQEMVKNGKIVYVEDTYGAVKPYICPIRIVTSDRNCEYYKDNKEEYEDFFLEQLCDMPTYLIKELLSQYKDKPSFYKVIKRELIARGVYQNKKHKIDRELTKMTIEESDINDKYKRRRKIKCNES